MEDIERVWRILDKEGEVRIEGVKNGEFILVKGMRSGDELSQFVSGIREKLERLWEIIEERGRRYKEWDDRDYSYSYVRPVREALKALRKIDRTKGSRKVRRLLKTVAENLRELIKALSDSYLGGFVSNDEKRAILQISREVFDMMTAELQ